MCASVRACDVHALEIRATARAPGVRHCALHRVCYVWCISGDMCGRVLCMLRPPDKRTTARARVVRCRVLHRSCFARCVCGDMCVRALCMLLLSSRHTRNCACACCASLCLASFVLCALHVRRHALDGLETRACARNKKDISAATILRATFFTLLFSGTGHMDSPGK